MNLRSATHTLASLGALGLLGFLVYDSKRDIASEPLSAYVGGVKTDVERFDDRNRVVYDLSDEMRVRIIDENNDFAPDKKLVGTYDFWVSADYRYEESELTEADKAFYNKAIEQVGLEK